MKLFSQKVEVKTIEKIDVNDGDVLAIYVRGCPAAEERARIKFNVQKAFLPKQVTVVLLNDDLVKLQVLRING